MKKLLFILALIIVAILADNFSDDPQNLTHQCRWEECPYKGVNLVNAAGYCEKYGGPEGSDAYCLDLFHFQRPELNYDELEELSFITY